MNKKNENNETDKFSTYQVGEKYYIKYEGQEEREISKSVFLHLKESKDKEFKSSTKK